MEDLYNELVGWAREIVSIWCAQADWIEAIDVGKDRGTRAESRKGEKEMKQQNNTKFCN